MKQKQETPEVIVPAGYRLDFEEDPILTEEVRVRFE